MITYLTNRYFRFLRWIQRLVIRFSMVYSRIKVRSSRKLFVKKVGRSVMTRRLKKTIKAYARERFGSAAYWPHLAHFTEIRGEFIKGWIPHEYFHYIVEPRLNPSAYNNLGDLRTFDYVRFGDFAIKPLFLHITGNFYDTDFKLVEQEKVEAFMSGYNDTIVVKQEFGWGGKQVKVIPSSEFSMDLFERGVNYIIQPYIRQYKALRDLYPHSLNTFRVTTFQKKDGTVEILFVILRFGVDGKKVDNLSSGGQCIRIELTGKPSPMAYDEWCAPAGKKHKNTGFEFATLEVPMAGEIFEKCKSAHRKHPHLRLIGWDVCLNEEGEPKLVEWNTHWPTFNLEDALFGPFLTDDRELE